eukprot:gene5347-9156_t
MKDTFDPSNEKHVALLKQLWSNINPHTKLKDLISEQWSDIGFQGKNPATDFRGMGLLGLDTLVFISKYHLKFVKDSIKQREYPFAVTGINILNLIIKLIKHEDIFKDDPPTRELMLNEKLSPKFEENYKKYGKCYLIDELFCIIFQLFDKVWELNNATYMDFGKIIKETETQMLNVLSKKPLR